MENVKLNSNFSSAIIVLGYQLNLDGTPNKMLIDRIIEANLIYYDLKIKNKNTLYIVTGKSRAIGNKNDQVFQSEAESIQYLAVKYGVDKSDIFIDNESQSTVFNAVNTYSKINKENIKKLYIITSDYHLLRSKLIFQSIYTPDIELIFIGAKTDDDTKRILRGDERINFFDDQSHINNLSNKYKSVTSKPIWRMIERELNKDLLLKFKNSKNLTFANYNNLNYSIEILKKKFENNPITVYTINTNSSSSRGFEEEEGVIIGNNNFNCNLKRFKSKIFRNIYEKNHLYDYQISSINNIIPIDEFDDKDVDEIIYYHLLNSKTTFLEISSKLNYFNQDEIFRKINKKLKKHNYGMKLDILGATSPPSTNGDKEIIQIIRIDIDLNQDGGSSEIYYTLSKSNLFNIYNCV